MDIRINYCTIHQRELEPLPVLEPFERTQGLIVRRQIHSLRSTHAALDAYSEYRFPGVGGGRAARHAFVLCVSSERN